MSKEPTRYFVAWVSDDNAGKPNMAYEAARREYMYRVFRDDRGSRSAYAVTEAMTYEEAEAKRKEILLLTKGKELAWIA